MALMSADQGDGLDSNSAGNAENDESSYLKDKQGEMMPLMRIKNYML